jgi:SAM-dependent methyltransferase
MSEEREHRREEAEGHVAGDVGAAQADHGSTHQAGKPDSDGGEERLGQAAIINDPASPFVLDWIPRAAAALDRPRVGPDEKSHHQRSAVDLAMGRGRHAVALARAGFLTFGVDMNCAAVRDAVARARRERLVVRGWCADLTTIRLPRDAFDLVVVTRYLQRDLFKSITATVKPGGIVLYETFTVHQRRLGFGPTSPDHLLEANELARHFHTFDVLFYEEVASPEAVARIVARRRSSSNAGGGSETSPGSPGPCAGSP